MHQRRPLAAPATRWWAFAAGSVAGLVALGVAGVGAGLAAPTSSPVPVVGEAIIDLLPPALINFGKEALGEADKPVLLALVTLGVLALCGVAGSLEFRRKHAGAVLFLLVGVIGAAAIAVQPDRSAAAYVPIAAGLLVGYPILQSLIGKLQRWQPRRAEPDQAADSGRRAFLGWSAGTAILAAVAAVGGQWLSTAATVVDTAREKLRLPSPRTPSVPVPAGAELSVPGLAPYVTPNADFYRIDTALSVPVIDPDEWRLEITGMVDRPVTISYADLLAKPLTEHLVTLTCVSNEVGGSLIGNARWLGYPVRELLAEAGPHADADMVLSTSDDGFTAGTPLSALTDPGRDALLAVGMNGEPLPRQHGFPVRLVVPGLYGYVSATKWVTKLKVTRFDVDRGYWTPRGWSALGPIKLASRIDVPRASSVDAGSVVVAGVAWAQHTGIGKVELQIDNGPWQTAQLAETVGPDTWRQWRFDWSATPGEYTITVRATDARGTVQSAELAPPAPNGATGYHAIQLNVH